MEPSATLSDQLALERAVLDFVSLFGASDGDASQALGVLVAAAEADGALLERIERHADGVLWLVSEAQATRPGIDTVWPSFELDPGLSQTEALLAGRPWIVDDGYANECPDAENYRLLDPPIRSEACFPIVIDGTTVGMLSFVFADRRHRWTREEEELLTTAASVVQMAWAHDSARRRLDAVALDGTYSAAVTEALLACSQALLLRSGASAIEHALEAMLTAFGGAGAYVEENYTDPQSGLCAEIRYRALAEGMATQLESFFKPFAWERLPDVMARLAKGEVTAIESLSALDDAERAFYEEFGALASELMAPVFVHGEWRATVGLIDVQPRRWLRQHCSMLETAAAMFGAFWEREQTETELRRTIESRDAFVSRVSHELRTPLAAVVGFTNELAQSMGDFDEQTVHELLGVIAAQASEVSFIVDDLLVAARSSHARLTLVPGPTDVAVEVAAALGTMPPELTDRTVVECAAGTVAWADQRRVRQIVRNLVINARKYGGPKCVVRCRADETWTYVEVCDNGPGVPESLRASMFDAYSSGGSDPGALPSMGLGLSVSLELAERMGGGLDYRYDGWSTFTVRLPAKPD